MLSKCFERGTGPSSGISDADQPRLPTIICMISQHGNASPAENSIPRAEPCKNKEGDSGISSSMLAAIFVEIAKKSSK
jgi:hypothetical protein